MACAMHSSVWDVLKLEVTTCNGRYFQFVWVSVSHPFCITETTIFCVSQKILQNSVNLMKQAADVTRCALNGFVLINGYLVSYFSLSKHFSYLPALLRRAILTTSDCIGDGNRVGGGARVKPHLPIHPYCQLELVELTQSLQYGGRWSEKSRAEKRVKGKGKRIKEGR